MSTLAGRPGCPRRGVSRAGAIARVTTCLTVTVTLAGTAVAQTAAQPATAPQPTAVTAGWNEGFFLQTPDGDNRLQIGFVAQADGRFALDDPLPITNTFVMRKVRPTFTGRVAKFIDFKIMPELAGTVVLLDGYFDIRFSPKLRLRSGKDKTPVGYELLISDAYLIFPERSVVSLLVPNRDVGFQAQGDLAGGKLVYPGGIFNGNPPDGTSATTDVDTNNGKDSRRALRLDALPVGAIAHARQLRRPSRRIDWNADGRAAVVQDLGRTDLLLVPGDHHGRRATEPRDARGLPLYQGLRRLRRVRAARRWTS